MNCEIDALVCHILLFLPTIYGAPFYQEDGPTYVSLFLVNFFFWLHGRLNATEEKSNLKLILI